MRNTTDLFYLCRMDELVSHIEFLLHEHNCVIIPDFGGFVVDVKPSSKDGVSSFLPPKCELGFNCYLTHNDGLLAQSYMKSYQMTFEAAMMLITRDVEDLKSLLKKTRRVEMGKLGSIVMNNDKRLTFMPAQFVRPSLFGLDKASLRPLVQMHSRQTTPVNEMPSINNGSRFAGVAVLAVSIILLLIMFFIPEGGSEKDRQFAQMFADVPLFDNKENIQQPLDFAQTDLLTTNIKAEVSSEELQITEPELAEIPVDVPATPEVVSVEIPAVTPTVETKEIAIKEVKKSVSKPSQKQEVLEPQYYVIMGVFEFPESVQNMVETLQEEGFKEIGTQVRKGRTDVYVASFTNGEEAQAYLHQIQEKYPSHSEAWILKK